MQDDRFSIYIFTKYKKNTAFQTSPAEKKKNGSDFKFQLQTENFRKKLL